MTRDEERQAAQARAQQLWDGMDSNEQTGVRFGMFPVRVLDEPFDQHQLALGLMDCAKANGGMRA